jgi:hypothetical protein
MSISDVILSLPGLVGRGPGQILRKLVEFQIHVNSTLRIHSIITAFSPPKLQGDLFCGGIIQTWIEKRYPVAAGALQAFATLFDGKLEEAQIAPLEGVTQKLDKFYRGYLLAWDCSPFLSLSKGD